MPFGAPSSPTVGTKFPTVNPLWEWDGVKWMPIAGTAGSGTPVTLRLTSLLNTDDFIAMRVISGAATPHLVAASVIADYAAGAPAATEPAAFTAGMWSAAATANPGEISFDLITLPSDGGSAITALEYRVGTGSAIAFTGTGTGVRVVTAGLTAGVASDLQVRAVNSVGAGAWSDIKNRTPAASGGGGTLSVVGTPVVGESYSSALTVTIPAVGNGNSLIILTRNDKADTRVDGATEDGAAPSLYAGFVHFFSIENITDARTSVTIRTYDTYPTPSDATTAYAVYEVNAAGLILASTLATSNATGLVVNTPFTTTAANAAAFCDIAMSNASTQTGANGWSAVPGTPSGYIHSAYNANVGAVGAKTVDITLGDSRQWHASVLAYARA